MARKYVDVRRRVASVSGMTNPSLIYDLTVADSGLPVGTYIQFNGSIVRVASPVPTTIPAGMAHGRVFRSGDYQFRYLGTQNGVPRVEEIGSNFASRLQVRSSGTTGNDSFVVFDTMDFGPSDFVDFDQGTLRLASGISHLLEAGAFSSDRAVQLRWSAVDESGVGTLVGSICGAVASGVCGGNSVYTTIPTSDTVYRLELSDPAAVITNIWATVASQPTFQTVTPPTAPTGVVAPPNPLPSGQVPASGAAPPPSGEPFMGFAYNASGHITLVASGTTMYVSSISGSDSNDGLSTGSPKATLVAAHNALSNGNNRILLARSGTYTGPGTSSTNVTWLRKGLSRKYPFIVGAYGVGAQPIVSIFGSVTTTTDYLACEDLNLRIPTFHKGGNGLLLERCQLFAADIQGDRLDSTNWLTPLVGVFIRFCKILDSGFNNNGNWQGIFTANVWELIVEYCLIDHNGWPANITRSAPAASGAPDNLKHNCYFNLPGGAVIFRFNIVGDASSHAVHQRPGGINEWNLYMHNPMAQMGYSADGKLVYAPNGVSGYVADNVAITATNTTPSLPKGIFFQFNNVNGLTVARNIACFKTSDSTSNNVMFRQEKSSQGGVLNNINYYNNIAYSWASSPSNGIQTPTGAGTDPTNVTTSGNHFEDGAAFANPSGALYWVSRSGLVQYDTLAFMSGVRNSGIIIGASTDPTLIINNIKAMFAVSG